MTQLKMKTDEIVSGTYVSDAAYQCDNSKCRRYSVAAWTSSYDPSQPYRSGEPEEDDDDEVVVWSPPPIERPEFADVPEHIAVAAREAWLCLAYGAYIGSCAVARSVIEAAAKSFGITVTGIAPKIDALAKRELIWGHLVESAHVVRHFGNDAAHGDITEPASASEARDVLDIMNELLHQLYTTPARATRLRKSHQDRKA